MWCEGCCVAENLARKPELISTEELKPVSQCIDYIIISSVEWERACR